MYILFHLKHIYINTRPRLFHAPLLRGKYSYQRRDGQLHPGLKRVDCQTVPAPPSNPTPDGVTVGLQSTEWEEVIFKITDGSGLGVGL